jgi:hypothetical protein
MRRRILPAAGLLVLAGWLAAAPRDASGCAPAPRAGEDVDVADESALIVWDERSRTEHFVRRATFVGSAYDFGFLVPTPSKPDLAAADADLFAELARITEPATEHHTVSDWSLGCFMAGSEHRTAVGEAAPAGVEVLEQKRVGDLDASVLAFRGDKTQKPEDAADELLSWLNRNGYAVRPDLTAWLVPYIQNQWVITAFKIAGQPAGDAPGPPKGAERPAGVRVKASAVRMSFKTDRPFFPYREPADQRDADAGKTPRLLRVYVAAKQRMAGTLGDGTTAWPGRTVWANAVSDAERTNLLGKAKLPADTSPARWWLTEFEDRSSPRPGTDEVYFTSAADQSTVARQPRVVTTYATPGWFRPLVYGLPVILIAGGVVLFRRAMRPPEKPIADPMPNAD